MEVDHLIRSVRTQALSTVLADDGPPIYAHACIATWFLKTATTSDPFAELVRGRFAQMLGLISLHAERRHMGTFRSRTSFSVVEEAYDAGAVRTCRASWVSTLVSLQQSSSCSRQAPQRANAIFGACTEETVVVG